MESNERDSVSSAASSRISSPPVVIDPNMSSSDHVPAVAAPRKPAIRPPLASTSRSEHSKSGGMRKLEKQAEVEESDTLLQEQHIQHQQLSPTTAGYPELPRLIASLDVPGRAASFDSSSLTSNGSLPTPQNSIEKQNSLERPARLGYSENSSPAISRDSSTECNPYTDYTGADLEAFIRGHLNKSAKDREVLMSIEQRLSDFVKQGKTQCYSFPQMSSYHRMFVHRVSAYFGLDHNVDQTGKAVIVSLTPNTRVPDFKFRDLCSDLLSSSTSSAADNRKPILKRDSSDDTSRQANISLENTLVFGSLVHGSTPASSGAGSPRAASVDGSSYPNGDFAFQNSGNRSFEEREADYQKARRRIFNEAMPLEQQGATNSLGSPSSHPQPSSLTWGSTDNPNVLPQQQQHTIAGPYIVKANSFGGTTPAQQPQQPPVPAQRTLPLNMPGPSTNISSQLSTSPSPGGTLVIPQQQQQRPLTPQPQVVNTGGASVSSGAVYVLAPSVDYVTAGSVIVNPQTGETFLKRPDGTLQAVVIGTLSSPSNTGSPVQAAPSPGSFVQPNTGTQQQQQQPPQVMSRFLMTSAPGDTSPATGQPAAFAVPQQQPQPSSQQPQQPEAMAPVSNMGEVFSQLSIVTQPDLTHYAATSGYVQQQQQQQQPPQQAQQQQQQQQPNSSQVINSGSQIPAGHPISLQHGGTSVFVTSLPVSPGSQQPPSIPSFSQPNGSYSIAPVQMQGGQYLYQVSPGSSLLTGPPSSQSPEVSSQITSTGPPNVQIQMAPIVHAEGGAAVAQQQPYWILPITQSNNSGANDPNSSSAKHVIILPNAPNVQQPYVQQAAMSPPHQQGQTRAQPTTLVGSHRSAYGSAQAMIDQQQQQQQQQSQAQQQPPQQQPIVATSQSSHSHMPGRSFSTNPPPPVPPRHSHLQHSRTLQGQQQQQFLAQASAGSGSSNTNTVNNASNNPNSTE